LLLPLVIATLMLGVGMRLAVADFSVLLRSPRAATLGLLCMFLLLPLLALLIGWLLALPAELAIGLVLLAASPSASTSTLFTDLAHGDTALSVTLTAVSKVMPVFTIPLWISLAGQLYIADPMDFSVSFRETSERLSLIVLLPLATGMLLRHWRPGIALQVRPLILRLGVSLLVLLIGLSVWEERQALPAMMLAAGPAALLLCLSGMGLAALLAAAGGLGTRQRLAIGIEVGMQSGGTTVAIATGVIGSTAMAIPAVVYSLFMYLIAGAVVVAARRRAS